MKKKFIVFLLSCIVIVPYCSSQGLTYYSKSSGPLDDPSTWGLFTNGSGTSPGDFLAADNFIICNRSTANMGAMLLGPSTTLTVGDGTNAINVTIDFNNNGDGVDKGIVSVSAFATLTFLDPDLSQFFTSGCVLGPFNFSSTAVYSAANSSVVVPSGGQYGTLVINDNSLLMGAVLTRTLEVASGKTFSLGSNELTVTQNFTGSGMLSAANATIFFQNTSGGNRGNLNLSTTVKSLKFQTNTSTYLTLGTDVTVTGTGGTFSCSTGSSPPDLNGHVLTLDNDIVFPTAGGATFRSSSSSGLMIGGTGSITNTSIRFNASSNTLNFLGFNRSGSSITIATNSLNITDSLSVLGGTLNTGNLITIKSTSSLKGRVGRVSGTISGNVTVETFIPGTTTGWANLGVNGVTGQTVANWDTYVSSGGANGIPMTCGGCAYSQSVLPNWFNSITGWDESTSKYDTMVVATTSLDTGRGFWVYVGDGFSTTNDLKLVNTGPIVQGSVSVGLTAAGTGTDQGYNLVANPYASPIGWSKVLAASGGTASGIADAIYVWNADLGVTTSLSNGLPSHGSGGITNVIPAGQGFYVATTTATNLVFDESVKLSNNTGTNPLLKPASPSSTEKVFRLRLQGAYDADETAFRFNAGATSGFDRSWDAKKFFQSPGYAGYPGPYTKYTTISSKDNMNEDYSINSNPPLTTSLSIPVLAKVSSSGTYTISAKDFQNFDMCVGIIDKLDNSYHDLRQSDYICTINDTTYSVRFDLVLCKDESLGETTSVNQVATAINNNVLISQDAQGAYVKTSFEKDTKAVISGYNIMGQKIMEDVTVNGTVNTTYLPLNSPNQVVFVKVASDSGIVSKKILLH
ncbi:MAG: hypothetical protein JNL60_10225 [Bacteroidia bacterium]|nr:hypothetical protein [Bacteroidia bacterium]